MGIGLSSALVAGNFQAFSDFVMKALMTAKPAGGIESMQLLNRTVYRSVFLATFLALAPITFAFAIYAFFNIEGPAKLWIIAGAAVYIVFSFIVTIFGNVPMNNRLDQMQAMAPETTIYWQTYGPVWTNLNHIRMFASVATSVCFLMASVALTAS
jgi:uncharacterized membrane protein